MKNKKPDQKNALESLAAEIGLDPEKGEKVETRTRKYANVKAMPKKELQSELAKRRKEKDALELELKKAKPEKDQGLAIPPEMWGMFPAICYDYMAMRFGDHWKLTEGEIKQFGMAVEKVSDKYLPALMGNHPELAQLLLIACATAFPRMIMTVKMRGRVKEAKPKGKKDAECKPD